jgi:16S rRNA (uracil1498-N3)-methyltransferase
MTKMHRFFVPGEAFLGKQVWLKGPDARQIGRVLRLKPGDLLEVLDGTGLSFLVQLEEVKEEEVQGRILESRKDPEECRKPLNSGSPGLFPCSQIGLHFQGKRAPSS